MDSEQQKIYWTLAHAYERCTDDGLCKLAAGVMKRLMADEEFSSIGIFNIGRLVERIEIDIERQNEITPRAKNLKQERYRAVRARARGLAKVAWHFDKTRDLTTGKMAEYVKEQLSLAGYLTEDIQARTIRDWIKDTAAFNKKNVPGRPKSNK